MKALIFDCDGVLVDSEKLSAHAFGEVMREAGATISDEQLYHDLKGGSIYSSLEYAANYIKDLDKDWLKSAYRKRSALLFSQSLKPISGIFSFLKQNNLPRAVASNGPKSKILANLDTTGLAPFFKPSLIFSAHDIDVFKPEPDLFLMAANELGFHPSNCIVIEDSRHGAEAAQRAGMRCFGYAASTDPTEFTKHGAIPINKMDELENLVTIELNRK